jgi:hypothetical protein
MPKVQQSDQPFDAFRAAVARGAVPTSLDTAGMRETAPELRARAVWTAHGTSAIYASTIKQVIDQLTAGDINEAQARAILFQTLRALGYTPEGGFPDTPPGKVPPAIAGTLQDLASWRRVDLIVRTQRDLMTGRGQQIRSLDPVQLAEFPAMELIRAEEREAPRDWKARFVMVGGKLVDGGRIIALVGDPVWGELGSSDNFDDALDVDHSPFAFNSGMVLKPVPLTEARALGVTGPDGESIEAFHGGEKRPRVIAGEVPLPAPRLSMKDVDPEIVKRFRDEVPAADAPGKPGVLVFDDILAEETEKARRAYAEQ